MFLELCWLSALDKRPKCEVLKFNPLKAALPGVCPWLRRRKWRQLFPKVKAFHASHCPAVSDSCTRILVHLPRLVLFFETLSRSGSESVHKVCAGSQ